MDLSLIIFFITSYVHLMLVTQNTIRSIAFRNCFSKCNEIMPGVPNQLSLFVLDHMPWSSPCHDFDTTFLVVHEVISIWHQRGDILWTARKLNPVIPASDPDLATRVVVQ